MGKTTHNKTFFEIRVGSHKQPAALVPVFTNDLKWPKHVLYQTLIIEFDNRRESTYLAVPVIPVYGENVLYSDIQMQAVFKTRQRDVISFIQVITTLRGVLLFLLVLHFIDYISEMIRYMFINWHSTMGVGTIANRMCSARYTCYALDIGSFMSELINYLQIGTNAFALLVAGIIYGAYIKSLRHLFDWQRRGFSSKRAIFCSRNKPKLF